MIMVICSLDNNGDIGDKSRVVYVLDLIRVDMAHQSHHQYVKDLDWGDYHIKKSVWVGENMFGSPILLNGFILQ